MSPHDRDARPHPPLPFALEASLTIFLYLFFFIQNLTMSLHDRDTRPHQPITTTTTTFHPWGQPHDILVLILFYNNNHTFSRRRYTTTITSTSTSTSKSTTTTTTSSSPSRPYHRHDPAAALSPSPPPPPPPRTGKVSSPGDAPAPFLPCPTGAGGRGLSCVRSPSSFRSVAKRVCIGSVRSRLVMLDGLRCRDLVLFTCFLVF